MTSGWPDDIEIRRSVAVWGQLLDEALIVDGGGDAGCLDWPDDSAIADTLAQWGRIADGTLDEATACDDTNLDSTIAWLGGEIPTDEPVSASRESAAGAETGEPIRPLKTRKLKVARPGGLATTVGWTIRPCSDTTSLVGRAAESRFYTRSCTRVTMVAAAVAAVVLLAGQALGAGPRTPQSPRNAGRGASPPAAAIVSVTVGSANPRTENPANPVTGAVQASPQARPDPDANSSKSVPRGGKGSGSSGTGGTGTSGANGTPSATCPPPASAPSKVSPSSASDATLASGPLSSSSTSGDASGTGTATGGTSGDTGAATVSPAPDSVNRGGGSGAVSIGSAAMPPHPGSQPCPSL